MVDAAEDISFRADTRGSVGLALGLHGSADRADGGRQTDCGVHQRQASEAHGKGVECGC